MTSVLAPERVAPARAPRPGRPARERLRPAQPHQPGRPGGRRSPAVPVLVGAGIVIAALFALAVMHALLIGGQIRLDDMQREVASDTEEIRRLRLRVAELEAPHRVLDVARDRLGMVQPVEVGYLAPADVRLADADPVSVAPAEQPAPVATGEELGTDADGASAGDDDAAEQPAADAPDAAPDEATDAAPDEDVEQSTAPIAGGGDE